LGTDRSRVAWSRRQCIDCESSCCAKIATRKICLEASFVTSTDALEYVLRQEGKGQASNGLEPTCPWSSRRCGHTAMSGSASSLLWTVTLLASPVGRRNSKGAFARQGCNGDETVNALLSVCRRETSKRGSLRFARLSTK